MASNDSTLMSRGLGKLQRLVLAILRERGDWIPVESLILLIVNLDSPLDSYRFTKTHSESASIYRAISGLKQRGLIEKESARDSVYFGKRRGRWSLAERRAGERKEDEIHCEHTFVRVRSVDHDIR